jgi:hypothetical protein
MTRELGFTFQWGRRFLSLPPYPEWFWGLPSLLPIWWVVGAQRKGGYLHLHKKAKAHSEL